MPPFDARFSKVLGRGVSVWMVRDSAIAMLTPECCYNLCTRPFSELLPRAAGFLHFATRVVFSLQDFPTDHARAAAHGRALVMLSWDRDGTLYDRKAPKF